MPALDIQAALSPAAASDAVGTSDRPARATVVFSADGVEWNTIWETDVDTWYGTVAVGDTEVLLSAAQLTGGPIRIPLGG